MNNSMHFGLADHILKNMPPAIQRKPLTEEDYIRAEKWFAKLVDEICTPETIIKAVELDRIETEKIQKEFK